MITAALILLTSGWPAAPAGAAPPQPRAVILISVDTWRSDRLGKISPSGEKISPELDRIAQESVVFERAITQATWTVPSHASMLTSLYPSFHGAGGSPPADDRRGLLPDAVTLAQVLRSHGFHTQGLYFGPTMDPKFGFAKGFEDYRRCTLIGSNQDRTLRESTFLEAAAWTKLHRDDRFFLFIHTFDAHRHQAVTLAPGQSLAAPARYEFDHEFPGLAEPTDPRCPGIIRSYDYAVHRADAEIGKFLDALRREGLLDSTLVVITGDHGESLCDQHPNMPILGHGFAAFEEQIQVPLILRWPGRRFSGRRIEAPVRSLDIMPTILEALNVPPPPGMQGRSLVPDLAAGQIPAIGTIFIEADRWRAARTPQYKYIALTDGWEQLYDLAADPAETRDISREQPQKTAALRGELKSFLARERIGFHLLARGRKGDHFDIQIKSSVPITYHTALFTTPADKVTLAPDAKTLSARLNIPDSGDGAWLTFDTGSSFVGAIDAPAGRSRPAREGSLRLTLARNGKTLPAGGLSIGKSTARGPGPWEINTPEIWTAAGLDAFVVPPAAGILLWRARDAASAAKFETDVRLREALRAEGYLD
ncbi:MAG: sulfatase [Elusimicrobiota bacterium]|jgi:arylsulfatase A-like enzyme